MKKTNNILITGGAGFIGSNLCKHLLDLGHRVVVIDNLQTGSLRNLEKCITRKKFLFVRGDVNQYDELFPIFIGNKFDYIYHYAATVGVQRTLGNPLSVLSDISGINNILKLCKSTGVKRIFYSSSSEVYGEPVEVPQNEEATPLNAKLPYAVVKNLGEVFLKTYQKEFGLNYTIFRFFNTYGPGQSDNFVIPRFIRQALNNEEITIYGDGLQTRSFMYIDDNIRATTNAIKKEKAINNTINIGNDNEMAVKELAGKIIKITKSKSKITNLPPLKEGDMLRRSPDIKKMKELLLDGPQLTSLDRGLEKTTKHYRKHE